LVEWLREHLPDAVLGAVAGEVLHQLKKLAKWLKSRKKTPTRAGKHFRES
jgi:hypothetical protein